MMKELRKGGRGSGRKGFVTDHGLRETSGSNVSGWIKKPRVDGGQFTRDQDGGEQCELPSKG